MRVSGDDCVQARWFAEKDKSACMTYGYEEAMLRNLIIAKFVSKTRAIRGYEVALHMHRR